MATMYCV